jgi:hypothetical protein
MVMTLRRTALANNGQRVSGPLKPPPINSENPSVPRYIGHIRIYVAHVAAHYRQLPHSPAFGLYDVFGMALFAPWLMARLGSRIIWRMR